MEVLAYHRIATASRARGSSSAELTAEGARWGLMLPATLGAMAELDLAKSPPPKNQGAKPDGKAMLAQKMIKQGTDPELAWAAVGGRRG